MSAVGHKDRMHLTLVGLSHKTAPIEIREKLTFPAHRQEEALSLLTAGAEIAEAVVLSTCNRTEIYAVSATEAGSGAVIDFLCDYHDLDRHDLVRYLYMSDGEPVVRHLFRVAASLDSMIVGEAQILGQVKDAYEHSFGAGACSRVFNKLFRQSFEVGKRVRTETDIGESAVSVSYAAVELAKRVFDTLEGRTILILGAGKMSELTAKNLVSQGVKTVLVANRTFERAEELARTFDGAAVPFDELYDHMRHADIVISSTAATHHVVTKAKVEEAMRGRHGKPLFMIDIAVPRDIEPGVNDVADVFLYDVDDLNGVVESNLEERMEQARVAELIIDEEIAEFRAWLECMEVVPTVAAIRAQAESVRQAEMEKALKRLAGLSDKDVKTIDMLTSAIVSKLLHEPTSRLKDLSNRKDGYVYVETARNLYGLDGSDEDRRSGLLKGLLGKAERRKGETGDVTGG